MRVNLSCKDRPDHHTNMSRIFSWTTGKSKTQLQKKKTENKYQLVRMYHA